MNDMNPHSEQPERAAAVKNTPAPRRLRDPRFLSPLLVLGLAIFLRLAFVDLPRALAFWEWNSAAHTGGYSWDYPTCDGDDDGGGGPGAGGPGGSGCTTCSTVTGTGVAMPVWFVTEPTVTLWLKDVPTSYQPSHGPKISFKLFFKSNPDVDATSENQWNGIFSVGTGWFTPWCAYLRSQTGFDTYLYSNGRGGMPDYTNNAVYYRDHSQLVVGTGGAPTVINYASGAQDVFGQHTSASTATS